ncbi:DNA cytosine methyltransferase [Campylobacter jejuni]|uniref:DNA cytosine methyltransferase n=1 Tax=Campylobacter TaxID=194 RepID=UPI00069C3062|nr:MULTISPECIES: DNA cytosine methyltransferase [Campylobacter]ECO2768817.1 DNA cytosine methyltransferase [Campylobacter jejuni]KAJ9818296.1 DNA cytosine methyltransferase [Campylobacter jejuni]KAJ9848698.1 DNA cytosine methyltransferase [Campylobacter jejuni]KAJ9958395.1 DNA cytosine methyltransferase [Campylobacter jejuni]MDN2725634.1 DNA cytosine methyltransferase [Campylobacter coli]
MKVASFFAGVGGIDLAFSNHDIVYVNEIDKNATKTYKFNFDVEIDCRDIQAVNEKELPDFDILLGGFPCQAFSVAGYRKGFEDSRGNLFFDIIRIAKEKKPKIIFLENVKNLVSHDYGNTFNIILKSLESLGYYVKYDVLNAMHYGNTPQNRERIYIVCFKNKKQYKDFNFPNPIFLNNKIDNIVDFNLKVDDKFYYTEKKFKHYEILLQNITKKNVIYQWRRKYVRENKSNVCPTLTANMGTGGHNVPLVLTKHGIRKLTPKECFMFQGFPNSYKLPNIANSHLYKQAGNSVCVKVIQRIADRILN